MKLKFIIYTKTYVNILNTIVDAVVPLTVTDSIYEVLHYARNSQAYNIDLITVLDIEHDEVILRWSIKFEENSSNRNAIDELIERIKRKLGNII